MKLLLNTCVWGKACLDLEAAGHDVIWAGDWLEDPGDEEILNRAIVEGRILVTLDKDFANWPSFGKSPITALFGS